MVISNPIIRQQYQNIQRAKEIIPVRTWIVTPSTTTETVTETIPQITTEEVTRTVEVPVSGTDTNIKYIKKELAKWKRLRDNPRSSTKILRVANRKIGELEDALQQEYVGKQVGETVTENKYLVSFTQNGQKYDYYFDTKAEAEKFSKSPLFNPKPLESNPMDVQAYATQERLASQVSSPLSKRYGAVIDSAGLATLRSTGKVYAPKTYSPQETVIVTPQIQSSFSPPNTYPNILSSRSSKTVFGTPEQRDPTIITQQRVNEMIELSTIKEKESFDTVQMFIEKTGKTDIKRDLPYFAAGYSAGAINLVTGIGEGAVAGVNPQTYIDFYTKVTTTPIKTIFEEMRTYAQKYPTRFAGQIIGSTITTSLLKGAIKAARGEITNIGQNDVKVILKKPVSKTLIRGSEKILTKVDREIVKNVRYTKGVEKDYLSVAKTKTGAIRLKAIKVESAESITEYTAKYSLKGKGYTGVEKVISYRNQPVQIIDKIVIPKKFLGMKLYSKTYYITKEPTTPLIIKNTAGEVINVQPQYLIEVFTPKKFGVGKPKYTTTTIVEYPKLIGSYIKPVSRVYNPKTDIDMPTFVQRGGKTLRVLDTTKSIDALATKKYQIIKVYDVGGKNYRTFTFQSKQLQRTYLPSQVQIRQRQVLKGANIESGKYIVSSKTRYVKEYPFIGRERLQPNLVKYVDSGSAKYFVDRPTVYSVKRPGIVSKTVYNENLFAGSISKSDITPVPSSVRGRINIDKPAISKIIPEDSGFIESPVATYIKKLDTQYIKDLRAGWKPAFSSLNPPMSPLQQLQNVKQFAYIQQTPLLSSNIVSLKTLPISTTIQTLQPLSIGIPVVKLETKSVAKSVQVQNVFQVSQQRSVQQLTPVVRNVQITRQVTRQQQQPITQQRNVQRQQTRQVTQQVQVQRQVQRQVQTQRQNILTITRNIVSQIEPITTPNTKNIVNVQERLGGRFSVEVRRGGVFKRFGGEFGSVREAFTVGTAGVKKSAAASFRIKRGEQVVPLSGFPVTKELGRSKRDRDVVVQQRSFRISSPEEKQEITRKGLMVLKGRRVFDKKFKSRKVF